MIQELQHDVMKGIIGYYRAAETSCFKGPTHIDYSLNEKTGSIYEKGFPDSSVYVFPKLTARTAASGAGYQDELHLGVAKQFFETFTSRGDTVADLFCGSGTGVAAAALLRLDCVAVDISEKAVLFNLSLLCRVVE